MEVHIAGTRLGACAAGLLALAAACPHPARALALLDQELSLPGRMDLGVALAEEKAPDPPLDFDLLGKPPPAAQPAGDGSLELRRSMLEMHQAGGLVLLGLQLATTVVGQLNYSDLHGSNPPATARYALAHKVLGFSTLGVFVTNGTVALFAPGAPGKRRQGVDRVTLHKVGMAVAAAGMLAQGALGVYTHQRIGRLDQPDYAQAHLIIGYVTLAAVTAAVSALVL